MELSSSYQDSLDLGRKIPLAVVGGLCAILTYLWVLGSGLGEVSLTGLPLGALGGLALALSLLDLRIGLGLLIFAIGISPEFTMWGISNLRLEDFLFPALLLGWLCRSLAKNERFAPTDLKLPLFCTVLVSLISSLQNSIYADLDLVNCAFRLAKMVEYFLIFTLTLNVLRRREDLQFFAALMPMVAALVGVYGILQALSAQGRVAGPLGETPNILGGYYVFHICLAAGLISSGAPHRALLLACAVLMTIPLLYTLSRTSYVALCMGLLALFAARRNGWTALILVLSLVTILASGGLSDRFRTILEVAEGEAPESLVMRVKGWKVFLDYLPETPLLGQGIGNVALGAFDNECVRLCFELGLLGLWLFVWMFSRVLGTSFRMSRRGRDPTLQGFAMGCYAGTVALLVHSLAATTFTTIRTSEPFFFAVGILYSARLLTEGRQREEDLPGELPPAPRPRLAPPLIDTT